MWKTGEVVHAFPRPRGGRFFSTAGVENILLVLWKTWGKMLKMETAVSMDHLVELMLVIMAFTVSA